MKFDFILKMENLDYEQEFMVKNLGLDGVFDKSSGQYRNPRVLSIQEKKRNYFDQLSDNLKTRITNFYKYDFQLFDYDPQIYL